ncbi:hypothetical protein BBJ28_00016394 [Nothophytophthora sp. Chile5]|nr:hypothetical protein BBJ28_00016394 [Nothophytophthora sp. Chile5]
MTPLSPTVQWIPSGAELLARPQPPTKPGPLRCLRAYFEKLSRFWFALQLGHHGGEYSIERLLALDEYTQSTPLSRVLLVGLGTPLPMMVLIISQESVPLQDPRGGWRANYGFWIRFGLLGGVLTYAIGVHLRCLIEGVFISSRQLALLIGFAAVGLPAVAMGIAEYWVFPIPFAQISLNMIYVTLFIGSFRVIVGKSAIHQMLTHRKHLVRYVSFIGVQLLMSIIYPAYQVLFDAVTDTPYELAVILLLPVVKLIMKNILSRAISHMEDLVPETVIFTVDFFNALYVATCMQRATSTLTVALIMAIDFSQTALALHRLHQRTRSILARLHQTADPTKKGESLVTAIRVLCRNPHKIENQARSSIRRFIAANSMTENPASLAEDITAVEGARCRSNIVHETLEMLFTSECLVLTEYLKVVIPLLYGNFILMMVHLPNAQYHTELKGITHDNVNATVHTIFIYAALEFVSFAVLATVLQRNCSMQVLYQLAFMLETHMPLVQSKLMSWMLITLSYRVIHFVRTRLRAEIGKLTRFWFALQMSHHGGKYSMERLLALDEYTRSTSLLRVLLVCVGTPLPMVALVLLQECVPLQDPADGWSANYSFWLRVSTLGGVVAFGIAIIAVYMVTDVRLSSKQLALVFVCQAVVYPLTGMIVAAHWVFPIPFTVITIITIYVACFVGSFRVIIGTRAFHQMLEHRDQLIRLCLFTSSQSFMAISYAAYQVLFDTARDTRYELPMLLLLPVIKLIMKNIVSHTISHMEDMMPEAVIFTVDFFNAVYLASCMQSTSSMVSVMTIVALDFTFMAIALRGLHRRTTTILQRLHEATGTIGGSGDLLHTVGAAISQFVKPTRSDEQRAAQNTTHDDPKAQHSGILGETLEVLFTSECLVLTEYLKSVIPFLYGTFMLVMAQLPNLQYHSDLVGVTRENVLATVSSVFVYALLEVVSFVVLAAVMQRNCGMRALYHLAFVLETQMMLVQIKLLIWVLMTMSFRVVHFGTFSTSTTWYRVWSADAGSQTRPQPTPSGESRVRTRLRAEIGKLTRFWFALQMSHHGGKYSMERLLALDEYTRSTSLLRVLLVCVGTPLPMVALVLLQECVPLQDPADGWSANYSFWLRVSTLGGVVAFGIAIIAVYMVTDVRLSSKQLALVFVCQAVVYPLTGMIVAAHWVFPIPFTVITIITIYVACFVGSFRVIIGTRAFHQMLEHRDQLIRLCLFTSSQSFMAISYAAYQVLFDTARDTRYELPMLLLLPVIKLIMKNIVSHTISHMEDMMPEAVIFTVDFFNAVYLASCMQSTSSMVSVMTIVALDFTFMAIALRGLHRRTTTILQRLHEATGTIGGSGDLLHTVGAAISQFVKPTRSDEQRAAQNTTHDDPKAQHSGILGETLEVLFTSECLVLTEYLKSVIPFLYGTFMLVMAQLPNLQYHSDLVGVTRENVLATVSSVFVYALLEVVSFVVLAAVMQRNCGMRALYHLAFVLETQTMLVQLKLLIWVLMTMSFRVVHFGTFAASTKAVM